MPWIAPAIGLVGGLLGGGGEKKAAGMNQANMEAAIAAWQAQMAQVQRTYGQAQRKLAKGTGALKAGFRQSAQAIRQGAGQASLAAQKAAYRAQSQNLGQISNAMQNRGLTGSTAALRGLQGVRDQTAFGLGQVQGQIGAAKGGALGSIFAQRGQALASQRGLQAALLQGRSAAMGLATKGMSDVYTTTQVNAPTGPDFGALGGFAGSLSKLFAGQQFQQAPGQLDPFGNEYAGPPG